MKMVGSSPKGMKTLWEKEKLLVTSNFSFSHCVFKGFVSETHKIEGVSWKGLSIGKPFDPGLLYFDLCSISDGEILLF